MILYGGLKSPVAYCLVSKAPLSVYKAESQC
jgi:hypothetical protein